MYLNCKTFFSFRYGTFKTDELVKAGAEAGATCLAITNINNTCDAWDFYDYCLQYKIKPILGAEIRNEATFCYILLAKNLTGFAEINKFLSTHLQDKTPFPTRPVFSEKVWVIYPLGKLAPGDLAVNELIGVVPQEINKLYGVNVHEHATKFVVRQPVSFQGDKKNYNLHRLLRAVDKNIILSKQQPLDIGSPLECFVSPSELFQSFHSYPAIVTNTLHLVDTCNIDIVLETDKNKKQFTSSIEDDKSLLEKLAFEGMIYRYGNNPQAKERVKKELDIIHRMGFNSYFLITWDVTRYAQGRGFFYVGRGSGANSIVAYCLKITDVDPIELDLYFERFLNLYRQSPPDFDIDFSWKDRDEVIDYVFKRYGKDYVALLGMHSTFQYNANIRELSKVFGIPKNETDALLQQPAENFEHDVYHKKILHFSKLLENFPNHLSIHREAC